MSYLRWFQTFALFSVCSLLCVSWAEAQGRAKGGKQQQQAGARGGGQAQAGRAGGFRYGSPNSAQQGRGPGQGQQGSGGSGQGQGGNSSVSPTDLFAMWEEEKLARDVYQTLAKNSQLPVFRTIAASESKHMRVVSQLLQGAGANLQDVPGQFTLPENQRLFEQLSASGASGDIDALKVGAMIEEKDIADLRRLLMTPGLDTRTRRIMENLERASSNHLRAFTSQLAQLGANYESQFLPQSEFDQIASGTKTRGSSRGQAGGRGRGVGPAGTASAGSSTGAERQNANSKRQGRRGPGGSR